MVFAILEMGDHGGIAGGFLQFCPDGVESFRSRFFERVEVGLELSLENVLVNSAEASFGDPERSGGNSGKDWEDGDNETRAEAPIPGNGLRRWWRHGGLRTDYPVGIQGEQPREYEKVAKPESKGNRQRRFRNRMDF